MARATTLIQGLLRPRVVAAARVVGYVVSVALVVWVAVTAVRDVSLRGIQWPWLAPAAALTLVWWWLLGRGWAVLQEGRPDRAAAAMWFRTQALRYLPGGFWGPASRVVAVQGAAGDRLATVVAENLVALCSGLAVAGVALTVAGRPVWLPLVLAPAVPLAATVLLRDRTRLSVGRVRTVLGLYLVAFAAYVGAATLVQFAVSGTGDAALVAGAAGLAWAAGLVVVVAPGGVGVRESVFIALLAGVLARGEIAAGAVTFRLLTIVVELIVLAIAGRPPRPAHARHTNAA